MKVLPVLLPPDGGATTARTGTAIAMQWRRALEQAQWQARPHASPGAGARPGARDAQADGARADGAARSPSAGLPDERARPDSARPAPRGDSIAGPLADAIERALVRPAEAPEAWTAVPPAGPAPARAGVPQASPAETSAPRTLLPWAELPEWPEVVFHASASGTRVSVGVRDAGLTDADALALHGRLRSRLARAGLELADLTVNGHAVTPDEALRDHA